METSQSRGGWVGARRKCPFLGPSPALRQHTLQPDAQLFNLEIRFWAQSFCLGPSRGLSLWLVLDPGNGADVSCPTFLLGGQRGSVKHSWALTAGGSEN